MENANKKLKSVATSHIGKMIQKIIITQTVDLVTLSVGNFVNFSARSISIDSIPMSYI